VGQDFNRDKASVKFTIRDLLLVTVIVALAAGWWADKSSSTTRFIHLNEEMNHMKDQAEAESVMHEAMVDRLWEELKKRPSPPPTHTQFGGLPENQAPAPIPPKD
jgi:hypothetical protein